MTTPGVGVDPGQGQAANLPRGSAWPWPAIALAALLLAVGAGASAFIVAVPFDSAAFGGLTVPAVLGAGFLDGFNPCAFSLLVLFATYTLTLANSVTAAGMPTLAARNRLLSAGALYVGAVWVTYFAIGLGLLTVLSWMGRDHMVARVASILALVMALWMLKDVFLPGVGPSMLAPSGTHARMKKAMETGGLAGMLLAGVLVGICTVPCSGAMYLQITAVLHASGGGSAGLALLALYNIAFIAPLVILLAVVTNRRVLGRLGRWNRANSPWVKVGIAAAVIAMSLGLMVSL